MQDLSRRDPRPESSGITTGGYSNGYSGTTNGSTSGSTSGINASGLPRYCCYRHRYFHRTHCSHRH